MRQDGCVGRVADVAGKVFLRRACATRGTSLAFLIETDAWKTEKAMSSEEFNDARRREKRASDDWTDPKTGIATGCRGVKEVENRLRIRS